MKKYALTETERTIRMQRYTSHFLTSLLKWSPGPWEQVAQSLETQGHRINTVAGFLHTGAEK